MAPDLVASDVIDLSAEDRQRYEEAELVERHRRGDTQALVEIYRTHATMVHSLALRLCGELEEAADVTQEIFLRVHRHLGRFRGGSTLKTWLYRVAVNHCRTRLSRRPPRAESLDDPAGRVHELVDGGRSPEERARSNENERRLERALAQLDVTFREAVVLRDVEDLAYDEIATVLGVPIGTVRSRIARGRARLRELLLEES
jgi:RNA polymerase sigma-70 factor (ECF subfamily)